MAQVTSSPARPPKSPCRKSHRKTYQDLPLDLQKHAIEVRKASKQQYYDKEVSSPKIIEKFQPPPVQRENYIAPHSCPQQEGYHVESEQTHHLSESWASQREASDASTGSQTAENALPSPQHTYYLLRALCGLELEREFDRLYRLQSLDDHEDWSSSMDYTNESSRLTEEHSEHALHSQDAPLMGHLLRHFMRLPLVREAGAHAQRNSPFEPDTRGMNLFWHGGLNPLLRSIHQLDLSKGIDHADSSFDLSGSSIKNTFERYFATIFDFTVSQESTFVDSRMDSTLVNSSGRTGQAGDHSGYLPELNHLRQSTQTAYSVPPFSDLQDLPRSTPIHPKASKQPTIRAVQAVQYDDINDSRTIASIATVSTLPASSAKERLSLADRYLEDAVEAEIMLESASEGSHTRTHSAASNRTVDDTGTSAPTSVDNLDETVTISNSKTPNTTPQTARAVSPFAAWEESPTPGSHDLDRSFLRPRTSSDVQGYDIPDPFARVEVDLRKSHSFTDSFPKIEISTPVSENERFSIDFDHPDRQPSTRSSYTEVKPPANSDLEATPRKRKPLFSFSRKKASNQDLKSKISMPSLRSHTSRSLADLTADYMRSEASFASANSATTQSARSAPRRIMALEMPACPTTLPLADQSRFSNTTASLEDPSVLAKSSMPWPWGSPVNFNQPLNVEHLAYGGFEVDLISSRTSAVTHSFVLRVRRPNRLDEYVVRTEQEFARYREKMAKDYPEAHVRSIPTRRLNRHDPESESQAVPSESPLAMVPQTLHRPRSTSRLSARLGEAARELAATPTTPLDKTRRSRPRRATLTNTLRSATPTDVRSGSSLFYASHDIADPKLQRYDEQRRTLRSWLRDTLSICTSGHNSHTARFLLSSPIVLSDKDLLAIHQTTIIDQNRKTDRLAHAEGGSNRAQLTEMFFASIREELIAPDGIANLSDILTNTSNADQLPIRYTKGLEHLRFSLAQTLYNALVLTNSDVFGKLKTLHLTLPWSTIRRTLGLSSKSSSLRKALSNLLLARPLGSRSLLQKLISIFLDQSDVSARDQVLACRHRISSSNMCDKIIAFVEAPRETKDLIRKHAVDCGLPLVVAILRGGQEPRLDKSEMDRLLKSGRYFEKYLEKLEKGDSAHSLQDNINIRLILDLQLLLRLNSKAQDAEKLRSLLSEESFAASLELTCSPLVELLFRAQKQGNLTTLLSSAEEFLGQLIVVIEALRARMGEPQKGVRIIAKLVARFQPALYTFLHKFHKSDPLIEEMLHWFKDFTSLLRKEQFVEPINIFDVLPNEQDALKALLEELQDHVNWDREKRDLAYQRMCKRFGGDLDGDDAVVVQGDSFGKSSSEPQIDVVSARPPMIEISKCLARFKQCIGSALEYIG